MKPRSAAGRGFHALHLNHVRAFSAAGEPFIFPKKLRKTALDPLTGD
jgi:hypothetical protein